MCRIAEIFFRNYHLGASCKHFGEGRVGLLYGTVRNKNSHNGTNKKTAMQSSDYTNLTYFLST